MVMEKNPRSVKRHGDEEEAADFELVFTASGTVELIDCQTDETVWCSVDDDDFQEEFESFLDGEDSDDVIGYLHDNEYVNEDEDLIDIIEADLEDESLRDDADEDDIVEGEFIPAKRVAHANPRKAGRKK